MLGVKSKVVATAVFTAVGLLSAPVLAQDATHEITITVIEVKNLDKVDELSKGDDYARATIGSAVVVSPVAPGTSGSFKPGWKLTGKVPAGETKVKLELMDKDLTQDDPIDINKIDKKRDLDFTVNTKTCKIAGFAQSYKCGSKITRAGAEKKKAQITFSVAVSKIKK